MHSSLAFVLLPPRPHVHVQQVDASTVQLSLRADTLSKEEVAFKKPAKKKKVRKVRKREEDDDVLKVCKG